MKAQLLRLSLFSFILSISLFSCTKEDAPTNNPHVVEKTPIKTTLDNFSAKYPLATDSKWEHANNYQKVSFTLNDLPCTSWFNNKTGQWVSSYIGMPIDELPEAIEGALKNNLIELNSIVSIDTLSQLDYRKLYVIDMGNNGATTYNENGYRYSTWQKTLTTLPSDIYSHISSKYPNSAILRSYSSLVGITVTIIDNNIVKLLSFNSSNTLTSTYWYVEKSKLPAKAIETLSGDNYKDYSISLIIYKIEPPIYSYDVFLEDKTGSGFRISFDPSGKLILN